MKPSEYAKAIVGGLIAALTAAGTALADGHITGYEGVGIGLAAVLAFATVFGVPNASAPMPPAAADPLDQLAADLRDKMYAKALQVMAGAVDQAFTPAAPEPPLAPPVPSSDLTTGPVPT